MAGAAYLSAKAAYSVGAGLVQIYTHEDNRQSCSSFCRRRSFPATEIIMKNS